MNTAQRISVVFLLTALLCIPVAAQSADPAQRSYLDALRLVNTGQLDVGLEALEQTADSFPTSRWSAQALLAAGQHAPTSGQAVEFYRRVSTHFPGSHFDATARMSLLTLEAGSVEDWISGVKTLAAPFGSPPIDEILAGQNFPLHAQSIRSASREVQETLGTIYTSLWCALATTGANDGEALSLMLFLRGALEPLGHDTGSTERILYTLLQNRSGYTLSGDKADPSVSVLAPAEGEVVGRNPAFRSSIQGADYLHPQVSLENLEIRLDGVDIRSQVDFSSELNTSLEVGAALETLQLTTNLGPLEAGSHILSLIVEVDGYPGEGPGRVEITRTFTVSPSRR